MLKTKEAIKDFVSKSGHHDTDVHETVQPAKVHETVKPSQHEQVHTAIDKEVHQDHHHHTVQPVKDTVVLPEEHKHNIAGVVHREHDHRDHDKTKEMLEAEQGKIRDERVVHDTKHTQSKAPVVAGEHVHHHVHETIQPVIQRETIQPEVLHTTVPIHEVHRHAEHHTTSTLPPISMSEFQGKGGAVGEGKAQEHHFHVKGNPVGTGGDVMATTHRAAGLPETHHNEAAHGNLSGASSTAAGRTTHHHGASTAAQGAQAAMAADSAGHHYTTNTANVGGMSTGSGVTSHDVPRTAGAVSSGDKREDVHNVGTKKPSLLQKLNPMVDADGDGKKGFMD